MSKPLDAIFFRRLKQLEAWIHSITPGPFPIFPTAYDIRNYGAKCNGATDDSAAVNLTISTAYLAGGGAVIIPPNTAIANPVFMGAANLAVKWSVGLAVAVGDFTLPTVFNKYQYKVIAAGTGVTSAVQPIWPLAIGATVKDANGVTWQCWSVSTATGVILEGLNKPTNQQSNLVWIGGAYAGAMVQVRNSYGWGVTNLGLNAEAGAAYCVQVRGILTDTFATEQGAFDECFFGSASTYNVLFGADPATGGCLDDVSTVKGSNCLFLQWEGAASNEPRTIAHFCQNAANGLGNTWDQGTQFSGNSRAHVKVAITNVVAGATTTTVTANGYNFQNGQIVIITGTGTSLDFSGTNQNGYPVTVVDPNNFTVPVVATGVYGGAGFLFKMGYPQFGVIANLGRFALYNCIDVGIGIAFGQMPTQPGGYNQVPGTFSAYEHESQSSNWVDIQPGNGVGDPAYPVVISGLHHGDAQGYGTFSIRWGRGLYASLAVVGGCLFRNFEMLVNEPNASIVGTMFGNNPFGIVTGAFASQILGWWSTAGVTTAQLPANASPFILSTVGSQSRLTSAVGDGMDLWSQGATMNLGISNVQAAAITTTSGFLTVAAASTLEGVQLTAAGTTNNRISFISGAPNGQGFFDIGTIQFRHGTSLNLFLTTSDATAAPQSGSANDALLSAGNNLHLASVAGVFMWVNGITIFQTNATPGMGLYATPPTGQQTRVGQLTIAAGTPGTGTTDVGGAFNQATLNNNFATLASYINALELRIHTIGVTA